MTFSPILESENLPCFEGFASLSLILRQNRSQRAFALLWRHIRFVYTMSYSELFGFLSIAVLGCGLTSKLGAIILVTYSNHDGGKQSYISRVEYKGSEVSSVHPQKIKHRLHLSLTTSFHHHSLLQMKTFIFIIALTFAVVAIASPVPQAPPGLGSVTGPLTGLTDILTPVNELNGLFPDLRRAAAEILPLSEIPDPIVPVLSPVPVDLGPEPSQPNIIPF